MWAITMDGSRFLCREKLGTSLYTAAAILPAVPVDAVPYGSGSTSMILSQVHHAGQPAACCTALALHSAITLYSSAVCVVAMAGVQQILTHMLPASASLLEAWLQPVQMPRHRAHAWQKQFLVVQIAGVYMGRPCACPTLLKSIMWLQHQL